MPGCSSASDGPLQPAAAAGSRAPTVRSNVLMISRIIASSFVRPAAGGRAPRRGAEQRYNIVRWTDMAHGGHFPALEAPDLWLDDVRGFFADLR